MIIADFSQVELRIVERIANEERLLAAYRAGEDTHRLTAALLLGKNPEDVTKEERQTAKAVNFGLLFGQSAGGLRVYAATSYEVEMTADEAKHYRDTWFDNYPAIRTWHARIKIEARRSRMVQTPAGRARYFTAPNAKDLNAYRDTKALNTPVQGGAAEVMLAALDHLMQKLNSAGLDATPIAVVHDEILLETSSEDAEAARVLLEEAMVEGMLDIFPDAPTRGLVEAHIGCSWAEK